MGRVIRHIAEYEDSVLERTRTLYDIVLSSFTNVSHLAFQLTQFQHSEHSVIYD